MRLWISREDIHSLSTGLSTGESLAVHSSRGFSTVSTGPTTITTKRIYIYIIKNG